MTPLARRLILLALLGSAGLLGAAFVFQWLGWAPCKLCIWQRWPHVAAIMAGAIALGAGLRAAAALGALSILAAMGLAAYHSGVELKLWPGPASCSGAPNALSGLSADALLPGAAAQAPALVLCDQLTPFFLGLTMANWNLLASAGLLALWIISLLRSRGA